jgi:hypothetical protein
LSIKLNSPHFDTIKVMGAELQSVLNTPTEHDFKNKFKKWQKHWERRMGAGKAKISNISFSPDGSISTKNYGYQW